MGIQLVLKGIQKHIHTLYVLQCNLTKHSVWGYNMCSVVVQSIDVVLSIPAYKVRFQIVGLISGLLSEILRSVLKLEYKTL